MAATESTSFCTTWRGNVKSYLLLLSFIYFTFSTGFTTFVTSISTIEKRFSLKSTQSGLILGSYEVGHLSLGLLLSHFGNRGHIPRILSLSTFSLAVIFALMTLPTFVVPRAFNQLESFNSFGNDTTSFHLYDCAGNNSNLHSNGTCSSTEVDSAQSSSSTAMAIFVFCFISFGALSTPLTTLAVSYMDDNVPRQTQTGFYFSLLGSFLSLGGFFGAFLNAKMLSIPEDLQETDLTPDHPSWIGAWWLEKLVEAGMFTLPAVPMFFLHHNLRRPERPLEMHERNSAETEGTNDQKESSENSKNKNLYTWKSLLPTLYRILSNPIFIFLNLSASAGIYSIGGFMSFLPKYLEVHFAVPAWKASALAGGVTGVVGCLGNVTGGAILSKFKFTYRQTVAMVTMCSSVATSAYVVMMFIDCETLSFYSVDKHSNITCLPTCGCPLDDLNPVCDLTSGLTFMTPCEAGCLYLNESIGTGEKVYQSCGCSESGETVTGLCPRDCDTSLILYLTAVFVMIFSSSLIMAPALILVFRSVAKTDKALSVGVSSCIVSLLGWMPSASVFGAVVDSACELWNTTCGTRGACWHYHDDLFRLRLHGTSLAFSIFGLLSICLVYYFSCKKSLPMEDSEPTEDTKTTHL